MMFINAPISVVAHARGARAHRARRRARVAAVSAMASIVAHLRRFVVVPQVTLCLRGLVQPRAALQPAAYGTAPVGPGDQSMLAQRPHVRPSAMAHFVRSPDPPRPGKQDLISVPFASRGALELYYESTGDGPAALLISGQAMTLSTWWRTVPVLAESFRVVTFDNRDMGRSGHWPWPYTVAQMADDAVAVLDTAGVDRAHIYGISLGGMVAQEVALRYPDRVQALILGATTAGGPGTILARPEPLGFFVRAGAMGPEEAEWAAVPYNYGETTRRNHGDRIAQDIAHRLRNTTDALAYVHQVAAAAGHNTAGRLHEITAPTLVVHGEDDVVIPPSNGRLLAQGIPNAELKLWRGAGHLFVTDEPRADRYIADFLARHTPARPSADPAGRGGSSGAAR
jgi:pimeloyl-ACP methyl ester carboxylesterase